MIRDCFLVLLKFCLVSGFARTWEVLANVEMALH